MEFRDGGWSMNPRGMNAPLCYSRNHGLSIFARSIRPHILNQRNRARQAVDPTDAIGAEVRMAEFDFREVPLERE